MEDQMQNNPFRVSVHCFIQTMHTIYKICLIQASEN